MPDITKCEGGDCPLKKNCYRYISADSMRQAYFVEPPYIGDDCDMFWGQAQNYIISELQKIVDGEK